MEVLSMRVQLCLASVVLLSCALAIACGSSSNRCVISIALTPQSATADHNAIAPGNQVQFSTESSVAGNCPMTPDYVGVWSTSDPANTSISNQAPTQGLATCLHATPMPATISNSSKIRGQPYPSATLVCK
jgi:hypothetical protein